MAIAREAAMFCDRIWLNAHVATLRSDRPGIGEVPDAIVACRDTRIVYAGDAALHPRISKRPSTSTAPAAGSRRG